MLCDQVGMPGNANFGCLLPKEKGLFLSGWVEYLMSALYIFPQQQKLCKITPCKVKYVCRNGAVLSCFYGHLTFY